MTRASFALTCLALAALAIAGSAAALGLRAPVAPASGPMATVVLSFPSDDDAPTPPPALLVPALGPRAESEPASAMAAGAPSATFERRYYIDAFGMPIALDPRAGVASAAEPIESARAAAPGPAFLSPLPAPTAPPAGAPAPAGAAPHAAPAAAPVAPLVAAPGTEVPEIPAAPVAAGAGALALLGFALRLYHRVTTGPAREKGLRSAVLARLRAAGPARERDLAAALDVDRTTARYHARLLVKSGLVVERRVAKITWYALAGDPRAKELNEAAVALAHPLAKALFDATRSHERARLGELAHFAATSPQNANYHLARLVAAGALAIERGPDGARYRVATRETPDLRLNGG